MLPDEWHQESLQVIYIPKVMYYVGVKYLQYF